MSNNNSNSFEEMSESFKRAYGLAAVKHYRQSVPLYEKAVQQDSNNFAALNNLALSKIHIAIEEKDIDLLKNAINDLREAIRITKEVYQFENGYPIAQGNLLWAEEEMKKFG